MWPSLFWSECWKLLDEKLWLLQNQLRVPKRTFKGMQKKKKNSKFIHKSKMLVWQMINWTGPANCLLKCCSTVTCFQFLYDALYFLCTFHHEFQFVTVESLPWGLTQHWHLAATWDTDWEENTLRGQERGSASCVTIFESDPSLNMQALKTCATHFPPRVTSYRVLQPASRSRLL